MGLDSASAADRIRPDESVIKFSFTSVASAYQEIRAVAANRKNPPLYISVKVTVPAHVVFGDASVATPTTSHALFEPSDGWQDMMLLSSDSGFRVIGDTTSGDIYIWISGH